jgi:hypothetical protein
MAKASGKQPTILQMDIVNLWILGLSVKEIADKLNCSAETVRSVKNNDTYKQIYYDRQREQVVDLLPLAIRRLRDILRDDETQASVSIAAIKEIFDRAHLSELTDNVDKQIQVKISYE